MLEVSNEVLLEKINNLHSTGLETLERVKQTNGRVKKLEIWKAYLLGAWAVITVVGGFAINYIVNRQDSYQIQQDSHIQQLIDKSVSENNDKYFVK